MFILRMKGCNLNRRKSVSKMCLSETNTYIYKCMVICLIVTNGVKNVESSGQILDNKIDKDPVLSELSVFTKNASLDYSFTSKIAWLKDLYDHHLWDRYLVNASDGCGTDMRTYVQELKAGTLWASKMYDASGHYSGNLLFGNDFWLGSLNACMDLLLEQYYDSIPPFPTRFHVTRFNISLNDGHVPQSRALFMGTCLPESCTSEDIASILKTNAKLHKEKPERSSLRDKDKVKADLFIDVVRPVPGPYRLWNDPKFYIVGIVGTATLVLIIVASIYEGYLEHTTARSRSHRDSDVEMSQQNNNNDRLKIGVNEHVNSAMKQKKEIGNGKNKETINIKNENGDANKTSREDGQGNELGLLSEILLSFSALSNGRKILQTEETTDDTLTCLHGMRFMSVIWVIMVHTYLSLFTVADNKMLRTVTERNFLYQNVGNASYSVDTFFFISGLLVTILYYRTAEKESNSRSKTPSTNSEDISKVTNGYTNRAMSANNLARDHTSDLITDLMDIKKESLITKSEFYRNLKKFLMYLLYRFIRLTPAYLFVIGVNELVLRYSHNNSVFEPMIYDHITCDKYWWRNALYINNLFPQREMCMVWSWYMANDTQFYVVGIILLLISARFFKFSAISLFVLMVSSWLTTIYVSWSYQYKARIQDPFEMFDPLYDKPWSRLGPYLIGMVVGWYLHTTRCRVSLPAWLVLAGWPASLAVMGSLIYGMLDGHLEVWPTAFYVSIGHTAWGVALAWVTIACCTGYGGLVNSALSYRGALPLSRLTYCAYLIHPTIMMLSTFQMDGPIHLQNGMVLVVYAGYTVMSFLMSFAISMAYEAPIVRLMKIAMGGSKRRKRT